MIRSAESNGIFAAALFAVLAPAGLYTADGKLRFQPLPPEESGKLIQLPQGFRAEIVARHLRITQTGNEIEHWVVSELHVHGWPENAVSGN